MHDNNRQTNIKPAHRQPIKPTEPGAITPETVARLWANLFKSILRGEHVQAAFWARSLCSYFGSEPEGDQ